MRIYFSSSFSLSNSFFLFVSISRFLRINLPAGGHPTAVAFADDASSIVVACHTMSGSSLYMYGEEKQKEQQGKLPLPGIKWDRHHIHEKRAVLTISGATATYGTADGSAVIASCSEGMNFPWPIGHHTIHFSNLSTLLPNYLWLE